MPRRDSQPSNQIVVDVLNPINTHRIRRGEFMGQNTLGVTRARSTWTAYVRDQSLPLKVIPGVLKWTSYLKVRA